MCTSETSFGVKYVYPAVREVLMYYFKRNKCIRKNRRQLTHVYIVDLRLFSTCNNVFIFLLDISYEQVIINHD